MDITEVRISKVEDQERLKAFVSVTFDNDFAVHGLRIIESSKGTFVDMPNRKNKHGEYVDVAHPINKEFRQKIQDAVLAEYQK